MYTGQRESATDGDGENWSGARTVPFKKTKIELAWIHSNIVYLQCAQRDSATVGLETLLPQKSFQLGVWLIAEKFY